jgi:hypothetical protein
MADVTADSAHLRELAAKCLRVASSLTDEHHVAALRQMAVEYENLANRMDETQMPNLQPPVAQ